MVDGVVVVWLVVSVVVPVSVSVAIPTLKQCHTQCLFENLIMLRAMPVIGVRE